MLQIKGKVALIIGAARGIGIELARQLLLNQVKAVVIAEVNGDVGKIAVQRLKDEFGEMRVVLLQTDITNLKELEGIFVSTVKLFDQLDIVINNIGVLDENDIERSQNTNIVVAMRSTKLAVNVYLPQYKVGNEGVVININAVVSLGNISGAGIGALSGLTAGNQYEKNNVRVISLYVGSTSSELHSGLVTNQLIQNISAIGDLRVQSGLESAGKALVTAIEQGANGSSWVGVKHSSADALLHGNWTLNQMRL